MFINEDKRQKIEKKNVCEEITNICLNVTTLLFT